MAARGAVGVAAHRARGYAASHPTGEVAGRPDRPRTTVDAGRDAD
ncbi:hypothetical protein DVS28_a2321 [Euzebya pacifica]|uniref:Uncharacterized protein n=1 Tax=Euzebya pacifica TaxID=1608957 RepID=A0A346XXQ6_9ACTN|nr:hypothetical protein DVS28_a2321 [Euzebya pacifica]